MSSKRSGVTATRSQRQLRIGELIRKALSEILTQGLIDDGRLENAVVTISEVRISPDLKNVTVFTLPLGGINQDDVINALNEHKKFIRGQLSRLVNIKYTPQVNFELDTSFDNFSNIQNVLRTPHVAQDLAPNLDLDPDLDPHRDTDEAD